MSIVPHRRKSEDIKNRRGNPCGCLSPYPVRCRPFDFAPLRVNGKAVSVGRCPSLGARASCPPRGRLKAGQAQGVAPTRHIPSPLGRVLHIVSIALCGPSVRSLTRPFGPPSPSGRGSTKSLSRWERGWGEGQTAKHVHLHHTSWGRGGRPSTGAAIQSVSHVLLNGRPCAFTVCDIGLWPDFPSVFFPRTRP